MRDNKPRSVALILLVVSIITLSIAFAMLSNKLTISGNAKLDPINWDIYFDNIDNISKEKGAEIGGVPIIDTSDRRKIKNIEVTLKKPGDKVSFTVDLVNESDITAIIKRAEVGIKTTPEGSKHDFIEFKAIYTGTNTEVAGGNVIAARTAAGEERKNITISIYYSKEKVTNDDLDSIPPEGLKIEFNYELIFEQSDELANMPTTTTKWINGCTEFTKKDTYAVGDAISFCNKNKGYTNSDGVYVKGKSEDFYVINDNGDTVTAFASYNLMVGSSATDDYATAFPGLQALPQQNGTYKNYELAFANKYENSKETGCTGNYCYLGYWANTDESLKDSYKNESQTDYPADVYDSNSLLWEPVQKYQTYFTSTLNKATAKMRLITYNELVGLGCDSSSNTCKTDAVTTNKREWIYNTSYWSASARNYFNMWYVYAYGGFVGSRFWNDGGLGVRPVITISKSDI